MTSYQMSGYAGEANRLCVLTVSGSPGEATLEVKDNDGKTTTSKWIGQVDQFGRCAEMHHACMRCDGFQTLTTEKQTQATSKPRCEVYNVKLRQGETMGVCKRCNYIVCEIASSEGFQFTVPEPGSTEFSFTVLKANSNHTDRHKKFSVWKILKAVGNAADDGSGGIDGLTDLFNMFGIEKEKVPLHLPTFLRPQPFPTPDSPPSAISQSYRRHQSLTSPPRAPCRIADAEGHRVLQAERTGQHPRGRNIRRHRRLRHRTRPAQDQDEQADKAHVRRTPIHNPFPN